MTVLVWRGLRAHGFSKQKKINDFKFLRKTISVKEENCKFQLRKIFQFHLSFILQHFGTREIETQTHHPAINLQKEIRKPVSFLPVTFQVNYLFCPYLLSVPRLSVHACSFSVTERHHSSDNRYPRISFHQLDLSINTPNCETFRADLSEIFPSINHQRQSHKIIGEPSFRRRHRANYRPG